MNCRHPLIICAAVCLAVGRLGAESLVVATYNVENYGLANRMTESGYREAYPKPEIQKQALRAVIRGLNADVLALQEMGPTAFLDELRRDLRREGCDYPYAALAEAADRERHVAVLSRRPFVRNVTHAGLSFRYLGAEETVKRGLLEVAVATSAGELTLFAFHLKSRLTERRDDPECALRRVGEATAIRDLVLRRFPAGEGARYLLLGDANDSPASKPVDRLRQRGSAAISLLLPARDSIGETWTYFHRKQDTYSRVDHVLVSPALAPCVADAGARIHDGEQARQASDHRPVAITLRLESR